MTPELQQLKRIRQADVYKNGVLAGELSRTETGGISFSYYQKDPLNWTPAYRSVLSGAHPIAGPICLYSATDNFMCSRM